SALLRAQAGIIAQSIKEEEACQVCGSRGHPNVATIEKGAVTESVLKEMEVRTNKLLVILQSSSKQAGENKRELKTRMNHLIHILVEENIKIEKEEVEHIKDVIGKYSHKNNCMIEDLV